MNRKSYTGRVFGRLTVTGDAEDGANRARYMHCLCECGAETAVYLGSLTTGRSSSCGCLNAELSIERLNNDAGYAPGNCKWATDKEQASNRRSNRKFELDGELRTISQIAELKGLDYWFLRARLVVLGWPLERAITEPSRQNHNHAKAL